MTFLSCCRVFIVGGRVKHSKRFAKWNTAILFCILFFEAGCTLALVFRQITLWVTSPIWRLPVCAGLRSWSIITWSRFFKLQKFFFIIIFSCLFHQVRKKRAKQSDQDLVVPSSLHPSWQHKHWGRNNNNHGCWIIVSCITHPRNWKKRVQLMSQNLIS